MRSLSCVGNDVSSQIQRIRNEINNGPRLDSATAVNRYSIRQIIRTTSISIVEESSLNFIHGHYFSSI